MPREPAGAHGIPRNPTGNSTLLYLLLAELVVGHIVIIVLAIRHHKLVEGEWKHKHGAHVYENARPSYRPASLLYTLKNHLHKAWAPPHD